MNSAFQGSGALEDVPGAKLLQMRGPEQGHIRQELPADDVDDVIDTALPGNGSAVEEGAPREDELRT